MTPAFWACLTGVLVLSLMPIEPPLPATGWDKSNHLIAFVTLTLLGCRAYPGRMPTVLAGLVLFGGAIEVLQGLSGYRFAEWGDLAADCLGIGLGYGARVIWRQASQP